MSCLLLLVVVLNVGFFVVPGVLALRRSDGPHTGEGAVLLVIAAVVQATVVYGWGATARVYVIEEMAPPLRLFRRGRPRAGGPRPPSGHPPTIVRGTGPGSAAYPVMAGTFLVLFGGIFAAGFFFYGYLAGVAACVALVAAGVLLTRWLLRRVGRNAKVLLVADESITLTGGDDDPVVIAREDVGLIGIETFSTRAGMWVTGIRAWGHDGQDLGWWALGWPLGRSQNAPRRALRRHGWPQVHQDDRWGDRLFGYDPGAGPSGGSAIRTS